MIETVARSENVVAALEAVGAHLPPSGEAPWSFPLQDGVSTQITATFPPGWLTLEARLPTASLTPRPRDPKLSSPRDDANHLWEAIRINARLPGLAKLVLTPSRSLQLRADLPLQEDLDMSSRVLAACEGFKVAAQAMSGPWLPTRQTEPSLANPSTASQDPSTLEHLIAQLQQTGWSLAERTGGAWAVDLEVAHGHYQALVAAVGNGVHVACDLPMGKSESEQVCQATAGLLLTATQAIRLARAAIAPFLVGRVPLPGAFTARWEVLFPELPTPWELASAFESLSVGCSLCGDEVKLLQDALAAERYCALRGWMETVRV